jgi:hypothetical protein
MKAKRIPLGNRAEISIVIAIVMVGVGIAASIATQNILHGILISLAGMSVGWCMRRKNLMINLLALSIEAVLLVCLCIIIVTVIPSLRYYAIDISLTILILGNVLLEHL